MWKALLEASAGQLKFETLFACEIDPVKQRWIRQNFPALGIIYEDIKELSNSSAKDICSQCPVLSAGEGACHREQVGLGVRCLFACLLACFNVASALPCPALPILPVHSA